MAAPANSPLGLADMDRTAFPSLTSFLEHNADFHSDLPAEAVRSALLEWYASNRRRLPWRGDAPPYNGSTAGTNKAVVTLPAAATLEAFGVSGSAKASSSAEDAAGAAPPPPEATPYGVWVSEIMCQQTRIEVCAQACACGSLAAGRPARYHSPTTSPHPACCCCCAGRDPILAGLDGRLPDRRGARGRH